MNSEQEEELIQYLASIGFEGKILAESLRQKTALDLPSFKLKHVSWHGQERMSFELHFIKDFQFNAYRLDSYKATHRNALPIEHKTISGIQTALLEQQVKTIDWAAFFEGRITDAIAIAYIHATINKISDLAMGQSFDGRKIQGELMYKYWPQDQISHSSQAELKSAYERSRDFIAGESGIVNANLAYHLVSGRLDDLYEKIVVTGLDDLPGSDLYHQLESWLSQNPKEFYLNFLRTDQQGATEFLLPVMQVDDWFTISEYMVTRYQFEQVVHSVYNGVDTTQLENEMKEIDWFDDEDLFTIDADGSPDLTAQVEQIDDNLSKLSEDPIGKIIADQLKTRYWLPTSFGSQVLDKSDREYLQSVPKIILDFPCEIKASVANNLMCGRAVMENLVYPLVPDTGNWVRLDPGALAGKNDERFVIVGNYPLAELRALIELIPIKFYNGNYELNALANGESIQVGLKGGTTILLEVNPEQKTLNLFSRQRIPIVTNLHFDPKWQSPQINQPTNSLSENQNISKDTVKKMQQPIKPRRKGRGL